MFRQRAPTVGGAHGLACAVRLRKTKVRWRNTTAYLSALVLLVCVECAERNMADKEITIEFEERTITGRYSISQGIVTVISDEGGSKSIQVAGTPHILEGLARIMLRELAQEGKKPERRKRKRSPSRLSPLGADLLTVNSAPAPTQ